MRLMTLIALAYAGPASAEVKSVTDIGFEVTRTVRVEADAARAYAMLGRPGQWWSSAHTYSGDARNMTMVLRAGGCFCEAIPKDRATIEHGRVLYARPGNTLRLSAALGPLQSEGVAGALSWTLKPLPQGGTEIVQNYVAGGYFRQGAKVLAPLVDMVMSEQLDRLKIVLDGPPKD